MATQSQLLTHTSPVAPRSTLFDRVLVGVDASPESYEAARQGAILADAHGALTLLAAWTVPPPIVGADIPPFPVEVEAARRAAEDALRGAREIAAPSFATPKLARGVAWNVLLDEAERERATLVAVGSHGQGRVRGVVLGSTTTELVHKAPCSVLVARPAGRDFPRNIVVGVDGSRESAAAYAAGRTLGERFGAGVWPVVAHGGRRVDKRLVSAIVDEWEDLQDDPVTALLAAAADGDLLVVGSRGLHGLKSIGSVSEQVAHRARCSTLIVRGGERS
jgi:nucleotide-binding universal stress UspA family protein